MTALAVWAGLSATRVPRAPSTTVLVAARDLPPGTVLSGGDLRAVGLPSSVVPPAALRPGAAVSGRTLSVAVAAGVPLTGANLDVGAVLPPGTEATPVRLADAGESALVTAGDRVDVLAAPTQDDAAGVASPQVALVVAADVVVVDVPVPDTSAGDQGGLVVVAATPGEAAELARAAVVDRLSLTVRAW